MPVYLIVHKWPHISLIASILLLAQPACKPKKEVIASTTKVQSKAAPVAKAPVAEGSEFRQKLQVSEADIKKNKLYSFSEQWYGAPYKYGGCEQKGVDCSCFVNVLYQEVYGRTLARSAAEMFKNCETLDLQKMEQGDLVFFKIGGTAITHVGVLLKGNSFIHASTGKGVIISSLEEAYYKKYFYCAGKVKKL